MWYAFKIIRIAGASDATACFSLSLSPILERHYNPSHSVFPTALASELMGGSLLSSSRDVCVVWSNSRYSWSVSGHTMSSRFKHKREGRRSEGNTTQGSSLVLQLQKTIGLKDAIRERERMESETPFLFAFAISNKHNQYFTIFIL